MSLLAVRDVSLAFGGVQALNGVTFDVEAGEIFAIIGPNGAGKTSLFNAISLVYPPQSGAVSFDGHDLLRQKAYRIAKLGIGRTYQNIELFDHATVLQNLLAGCHIRSRVPLWKQILYMPAVVEEEIGHRHTAEKALDFLELQAYRDAVVDTLPYGVRKTVEIARALCAGPRLMLLDEPSSGLNPEETRDLAFWIRDMRDLLGITIVLIEHDMSLVNRVSDRVLALDYGSVVTIGTPQAVQTHSEVVASYLGGAA